MRVAVVHDWLTGMRGGEKVLEGILSRFPGAELYTLVHLPGTVTPAIEAHPIHTSPIQRLPGVDVHYRKYLPLFPRAIEAFDVGDVDLVVSTSHCVAKGIRVPRGVPHVSYCHTPMRYIWSAYDDYFGPGRAPVHVRAAMRAVVGYLRRWDVRSSERVTQFVANSHNVAGRIRAIYGREAEVLHPWVDHDTFTPGGEDGDADLLVSALVPYKRVELAIEAYARLGRPLVVAGDGPERDRLAARVPANVTFLGRVGDDELRALYRRCRALVFPGEEDFGIVPLEAMACGRPVIAYGAGGALETVVEGVTGTFFTPQTAEALMAAVERFDPAALDPAAIRAHAVAFDRTTFLTRFDAIVERARSGEAAPVAAGERG